MWEREYKKTSDDPLQQYRRGVESGEVKRETSFEDFKKAVSKIDFAFFFFPSFIKKPKKLL